MIGKHYAIRFASRYPLKFAAAVALVAATALLTRPQSEAAETVPADSSAFVTYCTDHLEACRSTVVDINNIMMMRQIGGNHACSLPDPKSHNRDEQIAVRRAETKTILVWLKSNSTSRARKTDEAIVQAIKALWPEECR